jgi:hypothetical protein
MGSERQIDDAIDRAVRDIMNVEPRAGLPARVLDRLERPATGWFALPRLAMAAALIALPLIAFVTMRPAPQAPAPPIIASKTPPVTAPPPQAPTAVVPPPAAPAISEPPRGKPEMQARVAVQAPRPQFPPAGAVVAANVVEDAAILPGAIEPVDPLPSAAGTAAPIAIQAIEIEPLVIERIVVVPITPPR